MRYLLLLLLALLFCHADVQGAPKGETSKGVVAITGATKGLGLALARQFAKNGWTVAGCGRSPSDVQQLQTEFAKRHLFAVVDVTHDAAVAEWSKKILDTFGAPDLLINNAGAINQSALSWEIPSEEVDAILTTNVVGTFNCVRYFVPLMMKRGKGIVINMSSSSGREGDRLYSPYCASKFAVEGLTKCLAEELPKGLAVVSLDPGTNNTELLRKAIGQEAGNYPTPDQWAIRAFPFIMQIGLHDNGNALTVP
jgi:NAD(P)-dependent dehydrogenase (short-subunit alcohol dehydrogenase family)